MDLNKKLKNIQNKLKLNYGSFNEELPEQLMAVKYLTGNENILEIGGNIGRNSLVMASILNKKGNTNLVTLESDRENGIKLIHNKNQNNLKFHVILAALSKRKLIQQGWNTIVSDDLLPNCKWVDTITLDKIYSKCNFTFDTLVIDCEGAFYYILLDMPEILNNIKLIIMENDYSNLSHKIYIDEQLKKHNFYVDYKEVGPWNPRDNNFPCYNNFYEVWKK
jgi:FkbM family methyltransferase